MATIWCKNIIILQNSHKARFCLVVDVIINNAVRAEAKLSPNKDMSRPQTTTIPWVHTSKKRVTKLQPFFELSAQILTENAKRVKFIYTAELILSLHPKYVQLLLKCYIKI